MRNHQGIWVLWVFSLVACKNNLKEENPDSLFTLVPVAHSKVDFRTTFTADPDDLTGFSTGSGVSTGDMNNDGLADILFAGGEDKTRLFLNKGNFVFEDITETSGVTDGIKKCKTEAVFLVDINGDGWLDIYLTKYGLEANADNTQFTDYGSNLLFINQQNLTFREQGQTYGLNIVGYTLSANFFDYDNDGDLDAFILTSPDKGNAFDFNFYQSRPPFQVFANRFLENIGDQFINVTEQAGILTQRCMGQSASTADINNDGWLDLYIANDFFGKDYVYMNNGNKTFTEKSSEVLPKSTMSSMGSDFADINHDGWLDLFSGEMMPEGAVRRKMNLVPFSIETYNYMQKNGMAQYQRNMLQLNRQGKKFKDIGCMAGVEATEWSWASLFADFDNDGLDDLFVANGIKRDITNMDFVKTNYGKDYTKMAHPDYFAYGKEKMNQLPSVKTMNSIFKNNGNLTFTKMSEAWGLDKPVHSRGAAVADLDNDGDLDIVINNIDTVAFIYENHASEKLHRNFFRVKLAGEKQNDFGLGARVYVFTGGNMQLKELSCVRGYKSSPEPILHFGLDTIATIDSLKVVWLGGKTETQYNIKANQFYTLKEQDAKNHTLYSTTKKPTIFNDVTNPLLTEPFVHVESPYNDFKNYRLFHRMFSKEGPCIAAADVNKDGLDDFYVGGAAGQSGKLYVQQQDGKFKISAAQPWASDMQYEETACAFFDANDDGAPDLYIGSGSSEFETNSPSLRDRLFLNDGKGKFTFASDALPDIRIYTSCVAAFDFDLDGDLDLFVGGRMAPESYPVPPGNLLLQNTNGKFEDVTDKVAPELRAIGLVTAAAWVDYNKDKSSDLLLVGEWMPPTIFENKNGTFTKSSISSLNNFTGWWNTILANDFDKDGDLDFIAGNHGLNSIFKASEKEPVTIYAGDFDNNGTSDPVVFHYITGKNVPFVNRDLFCEQMPAFNNKFYTFENYAKASINDIFTPEQQASSYKRQATILTSCYIENLGDGNFSVHPLPNEAQVAPVYGIQSFDVNADGNLDILLSGNSYSNHFEYGNYDALGGLMLLGDGKGKFKPLSGEASGFNVPGDAKGMVKIFNKALNVTLFIVAQNNDSLKVYK